jgi:hypothetical protein
MAHIAESQHWYKRDGSPCYEIKGANGNMRPATLRDARKLDLVPGVSTILGCCDKPGLNIWKLDQAIMSALTLPRIDGETSDAFVARVKVDAKETARKAAERGTAIHAAIQGSYEGETVGEDYWQHVRAADMRVSEWMKGPWTAERSFASKLGFGGKVDLSHPWAVIDFKTKEFSDEDTLKTWDEHAMQLAAYREGLGSPRAQAAIVFVSVTVPGLARLIEIPEKELAKGWQMFQGLLSYWKAKSSFDPSWSEEVVTERGLTEAKA